MTAVVKMEKKSTPTRLPFDYMLLVILLLSLQKFSNSIAFFKYTEVDDAVCINAFFYVSGLWAALVL